MSVSRVAQHRWYAAYDPRFDHYRVRQYLASGKLGVSLGAFLLQPPPGLTADHRNHNPWTIAAPTCCSGSLFIQAMGALPPVLVKLGERVDFWVEDCLQLRCS